MAPGPAGLGNSSGAPVCLAKPGRADGAAGRCCWLVSIHLPRLPHLCHPQTTMPGMKRDCGGAAAVLGAFRAAVKQVSGAHLCSPGDQGSLGMLSVFCLPPRAPLSAFLSLHSLVASSPSVFPCWFPPERSELPAFYQGSFYWVCGFYLSVLPA